MNDLGKRQGLHLGTAHRHPQHPLRLPCHRPGRGLTILVLQMRKLKGPCDLSFLLLTPVPPALSTEHGARSTFGDFGVGGGGGGGGEGRQLRAPAPTSAQSRPRWGCDHRPAPALGLPLQPTRPRRGRGPQSQPGLPTTGGKARRVNDFLLVCYWPQPSHSF